jgi:hypothetical protein
MRLEPFYRIRFGYPEGWDVALDGEEQWFFIAEGRCEGALSGRFRAANHPRRRADGTFCPDLQGVVETDDGATVFVELRGYGRAYPAGARQIVGFLFHLASDARYRRLNDVVCACAGEVRASGDRPAELVLEVAELVWEPVAD